MSKRIYESNFLEGLTLCEINGLDFNLASKRKYEEREWRSAYLFGVISYEEFVKAHMILDSYNDPYISGNKWEEKMTRHKPKLTYGAKMLHKEMQESALRVIKKGALPSNIITDINIDYTEKFVEDVLNNRISYVYVDYDHDINRWIPVKQEFKINEILEIINASVSLWVLLTRRKDDLNIKNITLEEYETYYRGWKIK